jgi:dihydroorotate dehydrogenase
MTYIISFFYRFLFKPILFRLPADSVHERFLLIGEWCGSSATFRWIIRTAFAYENPRLRQEIAGILLKNPIGLAAGFDYNARLVNILPDIGFGFESAGTITDRPYGGNPAPMLGRLPKSRALLVNKGFKNDGMDHILSRIPHQKQGPVGISIGCTNRHYGSFNELAEDISNGFEKANQCPFFDYFELNISCPNLINIDTFEERPDGPEGLLKILTKLGKLNISRPVFIKMPAERTFEEIDALIKIAEPFRYIRGLIFSNLIKNRNNPYLDAKEVAAVGKGNFSGKPTFELSNRLIGYAYKNYGRRFIIIGCGGVFTAEDAYQKIKLGASLIQLITGMVYLGPQQIGAINKGLVGLLEKDGYKNIGEAIGVSA